MKEGAPKSEFSMQGTLKSEFLMQGTPKSEFLMQGGDGNKNDGDDKYKIPEYKELTNNPMIPTEQKKIYAQNQAERPPQKPKQQDNPILDLKLFQQKPPPKPQQQDKYPHPAVFYPNYIPNPYNPIELANQINTTRFGGFNQGLTAGPVPVFRNYNVNINGVSGSHVKTSLLFEDALPMKNVNGSFSTVGERKTIYEYIKSIIFPKGNGEDVAVDESDYNLLSHVKFMDINPYSASRFYNNPYRGLPFGFLLYRSCWPIRHNVQDASIVCAKNSTGVNVRIYRMTEGSYKINKNQRDMQDYDLWRDIIYYDYVMDQIIKQKVCPNFAIMYGYNISLNSKIDFDTINSKDKTKAQRDDYLRQSHMTSGFMPNQSSIIKSIMIKQGQGGHVTIETEKKHVGLPLLNAINDSQYAMKYVKISGRIYYVKDGKLHIISGRIQTDRDGKEYILVNESGKPCLKPIHGDIVIEETQKEIDDELNTYKGKALVCLTEAPNYSLLGWARKEYRADGNVKRMINTGYHPPHVWESVLFQLMAALYTMQIKGIVIRNFKLNRNVFVKDIELHSKSTMYWKYKIEGVDYYVPNYGYLVLIDTNYRDFDDDVDSEKETDKDRLRKIDGIMMGSSNKMTPQEIIQYTFNVFKEVINPDVFDQDFVNDDGIKPPEDILKLLSNIKSDIDVRHDDKSIGNTSATGMLISNYIRRHMTMFLHNRIGSLLTELEIQNILTGTSRDFFRGELCVMKDSVGSDRFVVHVQTKDNSSLIITKNSGDKDAVIIEKEVPTSSLTKFSSANPPDQTFDPNKSSLNSDPIETYVISNT